MMGDGQDEPTQGRRRHGMRRALLVVCLVLGIGLCAGVGSIAVALRSGPVELGLPGKNMLKLGSDDFVISNYSFQNGTTYFLDFDGNGVRNIMQLHYMSDTRKLELVLHHATKDTMRDSNLFSLPLP